MKKMELFLAAILLQSQNIVPAYGVETDLTVKCCEGCSAPAGKCDSMCGVECGSIGGDLTDWCVCGRTPQLQSDGITYTVYTPTADVAEKCSDCEYTESVACISGYYRYGTVIPTGILYRCAKCPSYNGVQATSPDKNVSRENCYIPKDVVISDTTGDFVFIQNCNYQ